MYTMKIYEENNIENYHVSPVQLANKPLDKFIALPNFQKPFAPALTLLSCQVADYPALHAVFFFTT